MIYTVTFNPSLDHIVQVSVFELGKLHRSETEELHVGGKGINVAAVLKQLGVESTALGFVAGFTGREIIEQLVQLKVLHDFVVLEQGTSRINLKLVTGNHVETEINGQGPTISMENLKQLYLKLENLQEGDVLVLSGSVPGSLPDREKAYADICEFLRMKQIKLVIDAEGEYLRRTLRYHPFLIKPNLYELERLFSQTLETEERIIRCGRQLQEEGARNIMISMGGDGALLLTEHGQVFRERVPKGRLIHSVGAGDAMIAGFLSGVYQMGGQRWKISYSNEDYQFAMKYSVATGSAAAYSEGYPSEKKVLELFNRL